MLDHCPSSGIGFFDKRKNAQNAHHSPHSPHKDRFLFWVIE
jgi:hypothetical protein